MSKNEFEIYFSGLTPAAQQEFLELIGETDIKNTNFNVMPITSISAPTPELQEIKLHSPPSHHHRPQGSVRRWRRVRF